MREDISRPFCCGLLFLPFFVLEKSQSTANPRYRSKFRIWRPAVDYLTMLTVLTGTLLVGVYVFRSHQKATSAALGNAIILFISASGFFGGARIIVFCFNPDLSALAKDSGVDPTLIFLGGLAMCWGSAIPVIGIFKKTGRAT